eukprot:1460744-Rhodomonas_salina.1
MSMVLQSSIPHDRVILPGGPRAEYQLRVLCYTVRYRILVEWYQSLDFGLKKAEIGTEKE